MSTVTVAAEQKSVTVLWLFGTQVVSPNFETWFLYCVVWKCISLRCDAWAPWKTLSFALCFLWKVDVFALREGCDEVDVRTILYALCVFCCAVRVWFHYPHSVLTTLCPRAFLRAVALSNLYLEDHTRDQPNFLSTQSGMTIRGNPFLWFVRLGNFVCNVYSLFFFLHRTIKFPVFTSFWSWTYMREASTLRACSEDWLRQF